MDLSLKISAQPWHIMTNNSKHLHLQIVLFAPQGYFFFLYALPYVLELNDYCI